MVYKKNHLLAHHYRVYFGSDRSICIQSKLWLTDQEWRPPVRLLSPEEVASLRLTHPASVMPEWDETFSKVWLCFGFGLLNFSQGHSLVSLFEGITGPSTGSIRGLGTV